MKTHITYHLVTLAAAAALFGAPSLKAQNFDFQVSLNTSSLVGAANSPFYLDFQLNEGSGTAPNSIVLSDFTFTGGTFAGSPNLFGDASGSLGSAVTLDDSPSSPFNEFFQGFTGGTTEISFDASVSQNTPGSTPDGFFTAILDSEPGLPQISTNSPDGVSLVSLDLGSSDSRSDVHVYSSDSPVVTAAVPETAITALLLLGSVGMLLGVQRFMPKVA